MFNSPQLLCPGTCCGHGVLPMSRPPPKAPLRFFSQVVTGGMKGYSGNTKAHVGICRFELYGSRFFGSATCFLVGWAF